VNVSHEQLTKQLDSLLSSNLTYDRLTSLTITNTPLTNVPRSVCLLTTLTQLNLDYNQLTRLPDNCLSNLGALTSFSACNNHITELQDGVFDGLHKLQKLMLSHNQITSIGLQVFHCPVRLTKLTVVDLRDNRIQSLEPWPVYLGQNGELYRKTQIQLDANNISVFSNMMGCELHCNMKAVYVNLSLRSNPIRHLSDWLRGWNISITKAYCIFFRSMEYEPFSTISLHWNYMDCDCVDFDIYKMTLPQTRRRRSQLLKDVFCNSPDSLYSVRMITVPLDQFVCELTERCPAGCRCVHRPANATLHVYCSNTNLTVLPFELPKLPKSYTKYIVDFSNNRGLHRLEYRAYFVNTFILDVSNCNLDSVYLQMWKDLKNIPHVLLGGNQLQSLPSDVAAVSLEKTNISLGRNPWKCSCDASWMSSWLKSVNRSLITPNAITCDTPPRFRNRNIMSISSKAFCVDPTSEAVKRTQTITLSSTVAVVAVALSVCVIVYRLRVRLYTRWKFHPFDRDECLAEDMYFDVFLSCSCNDNLPHENRIRQQLEQRGYRVCYPPRDFIAGEPIADNIYNAVVRSKRTVCLLTAQFLQRFVWMPSYFFVYIQCESKK